MKILFNKLDINKALHIIGLIGSLFLIVFAIYNKQIIYGFLGIVFMISNFTTVYYLSKLGLTRAIFISIVSVMFCILLIVATIFEREFAWTIVGICYLGTSICNIFHVYKRTRKSSLRRSQPPQS